MEKFTKIMSKAVPIPVKDIDTDMIIPAQYMTSTDRAGYGKYLFKRLRDQDPEFPLNQDKYESAQILVADSNFGCGSSREHAVWALQQVGFRAVIAPSFADIFFNNSAKNGLVLVQLDKETVDNLMAYEGEVTVDLERQEVRAGDQKYQFPFDPFRKECILNGMSDLDYLLSKKKVIDAFKA